MSENGKLERLDTREKFAKYAAQHWDYYEHSLLEEIDGWTDARVWQWREHLRVCYGEYQHVGWWDKFCNTRDTSPSSSHYLHLALGDPLKIAYTPSDEYGRQDRQVVTTVGRYLKKWYPDMDDAEIRKWADMHRDYHGEPVVYFALGADDIQKVYHKGPRSCMGGDEHPPEEFSGEYPCRIYDGPDTAVAFLKRGGEINARCVVRLDVTPMAYQRLYGDALLGTRLQALGFENKSNGYSLDGARLRLAKNSVGRIVCPYIDGSERVSEEGEFLIVGGGPHGCNSTSGFAAMNEHCCDDDEEEEDEEDDSVRCHCCEDYYDADYCTSDWRGEYVCRGCCDEYFVEAYYGRHDRSEWVHIDNCIRIGEAWYRNNERVLEWHNIVGTIDDGYQHCSDCKQDVHGDWHHDTDALVYIEAEDAWYPDDEVCTPWKREEDYPTHACSLINGQWVHDDDVAEYEAQQKLELEAA